MTIKNVRIRWNGKELDVLIQKNLKKSSSLMKKELEKKLGN